MSYENALIIQTTARCCWKSTHQAEAARFAEIAPFTELLKSPEHIHNTYQISPAQYLECSCGWDACNRDGAALRAPVKYRMPVARKLKRWSDRYGLTVIGREDLQRKSPDLPLANCSATAT